MKSSINRYISIAACIAALFFMAVAPARAAYIVGSFDPEFGGGFTGLSWSGEIEVYVPDSCLAVDGNYDASNLYCPGAKTTRAEVVLTRAATGPDPQEIIDFGPKTIGSGFMSFVLPARPFLNQVKIERGFVTGFSTDDPSFLWPWLGGFESARQGPELGGGYDRFSYALSFSMNKPSVLLYADILARDVKRGSVVEKILFQDNDPTENYRRGELYDNCRSMAFGFYYECVSGQASPNGDSTSVAKFSLAQFTDLDVPMNVPEPDSLALVFGALGAVAWVRRRKTSTR